MSKDQKLGGGDVGCERHNITNCDMCSTENQRSPLPAGERVGADRPATEVRPSNERLLLREDGKPYSPDMELSWRTFLGNRGAMSEDFFEVARIAYIAAWHASLTYAKRRADETDGSQPINTAPQNGVFLVSLELCPELWWPAHRTDGGPIFSNAHGILNYEKHSRVTRATHWRPMPPPPGSQLEPTPSLLRPASTKAPPGCHCQERCMAPVVMGRQMSCRDPEKAARFAVEKAARFAVEPSCPHDWQVISASKQIYVCKLCAQQMPQLKASCDHRRGVDDSGHCVMCDESIMPPLNGDGKR